MPRPYRTALSKEELSERARNAALARTTIDAHAHALVAKWPEATDESRGKILATLAPLLAPRSNSGGSHAA